MGLVLGIIFRFSSLKAHEGGVSQKSELKLADILESR